jgi:membrane-associated phospholipid phosphatase
MKVNSTLNKFLLLIIAFTISSSLYAQDKFNFSQFYDESIQFVQRPLKWDGNDWLKFGAVGVSTYLISLADQPIRDAVFKDQSFIGTVPEEVGRFWGRGYATAICVGAFGLHGLIANDQSTKKIAFEIVQTTLYAGAITQFLKITLGRARPFTNEGHSSFHPFSFFNYDDQSFPSGEVTMAFALASVLANNSKSDFIKVICYIPAAITMASRMYRDAHWASDVFFGAAVGYFVGNWVVNLHENKDVTIQTSAVYPIVVRIKL